MVFIENDMPKHQLSIYLAKDPASSSEALLKDLTRLSKRDLALEGCDAILYYRNTSSTKPKWAELFADHENLSHLRNSSCAGVLLIKTDNGLFAITFGYGWTHLNLHLFEENFGLKVVLGAVDPEKLRSFDAVSLEAVTLNQRRQTSKAASLDDFRIDVDKELVSSAAGKSRSEDFGNSLSGRDSLKISVDVTLATLPKLLSRVATAYRSDAYKENFEWIDHIAEVRNKETISRLDQALIDKLRDSQLEKTWLSVPEIIDWNDFQCFRFIKPKQGKDFDDIEWPSYISEKNDGQDVTVENIKTHEVHCISSSTERSSRSWKVYKCLYSEVISNEETFILNTGKWYKVDNDYLGKLNAFIEKIPVSGLDLPDSSPDENEKNYNERVANDSGNKIALMDCKTISHGDARSKIEFADLFTEGKHIVHVKKYGGSSVLSHLFSQAAVSGELFKMDQNFRGKLNQLLPKSHKLADPNDQPVAHEYTVVFGIMSKEGGDRLSLPLFSKVSMRQSCRHLQAIGYQVEQKVIHQPPAS